MKLALENGWSVKYHLSFRGSFLTQRCDARAPSVCVPWILATSQLYVSRAVTTQPSSQMGPSHVFCSVVWLTGWRALTPARASWGRPLTSSGLDSSFVPSGDSGILWCSRSFHLYYFWLFSIFSWFYYMPHFQVDTPNSTRLRWKV